MAKLKLIPIYCMQERYTPTQNKSTEMFSVSLGSGSVGISGSSQSIPSLHMYTATVFVCTCHTAAVTAVPGVATATAAVVRSLGPMRQPNHVLGYDLSMQFRADIPKGIVFRETDEECRLKTMVFLRQDLEALSERDLLSIYGDARTKEETINDLYYDLVDRFVEPYPNSWIAIAYPLFNCYTALLERCFHPANLAYLCDKYGKLHPCPVAMIGLNTAVVADMWLDRGYGACICTRANAEGIANTICHLAKILEHDHASLAMFFHDVQCALPTTVPSPTIPTTVPSPTIPTTVPLPTIPTTVPLPTIHVPQPLSLDLVPPLPTTMPEPLDDKQLLTYVLYCLGDNSFYIGRTSMTIEARVAYHMAGLTKTTAKRLPVHVVECRVGDRYQEDAMVFKYMAKHGLHRVRGGSFCKEHHSPEDLAEIARRLHTANFRLSPPTEAKAPKALLHPLPVAGASRKCGIIGGHSYAACRGSTACPKCGVVGGHSYSTCGGLKLGA